jgi:hypothetical protein
VHFIYVAVPQTDIHGQLGIHPKIIMYPGVSVIADVAPLLIANHNGGAVRVAGITGKEIR